MAGTWPALNDVADRLQQAIRCSANKRSRARPQLAPNSTSAASSGCRATRPRGGHLERGQVAEQGTAAAPVQPQEGHEVVDRQRDRRHNVEVHAVGVVQLQPSHRAAKSPACMSSRRPPPYSSAWISTSAALLVGPVIGERRGEPRGQVMGPGGRLLEERRGDRAARRRQPRQWPPDPHWTCLFDPLRGHRHPGGRPAPSGIPSSPLPP
jgi:hypothetical protein